MPEDMPGIEPELEPVEEFLADRGIESLASRTVKGHDGQLMTLAEALTVCGRPARDSIDAHIEAVRDLAGENVDILPHIGKFVDKLGQRAQSIPTTPEMQGAEKK